MRAGVRCGRIPVERAKYPGILAREPHLPPARVRPATTAGRLPPSGRNTRVSPLGDHSNPPAQEKGAGRGCRRGRRAGDMPGAVLRGRGYFARSGERAGVRAPGRVEAGLLGAGRDEAPAPWGGAGASSRVLQCGAVRFPQSGSKRPGRTHAAWRTNWTSRLIVTSLPRVKPPASTAAFQFTPNSVRSILVVASAPNLTWP